MDLWVVVNTKINMKTINKQRPDLNGNSKNII